MKKLVTLLAGAMLMMATSAMALPVIPDGFSWINAPFWTNTDKTTGPGAGNSQFTLTFEQASFESDFGLFSVTGTTQNPGAVKSKVQVFSYQNEPAPSGSFIPKTSTVSFLSDGSVSVNGGTYSAFDKQFGFYFDVHTGGYSDPTADYFYYTYNPFNVPTSQQGTTHVMTAYNALSHQVLIFLDDQLVASGGGGSDRDFNDMVVLGNDLTPVPEPGTMVLLGFGMLGLAIYGKRRMNKEA